MVFLKFENIKKSFKKEVLKDVNLNVKEGELLGLIGKSGEGKSVLLNILIGLIKPDNGKIIFEDRNTIKKINYLRKNIGYASQENMLFDEMSIIENAYYFGKLYGLSNGEIELRFYELLPLMGLSDFENVLISNLSGGMKKRANFLVSLIHAPKLLVLDEPTVGLDPLLRTKIWDYIQKINKSGTTLIVTSHLLDEIEENCSRVAILDKGIIIEIQGIKGYKSKYGKNKTLRTIFESLLSEGEEDEN